jgi:hypothetical protein
MSFSFAYSVGWLGKPHRVLAYMRFEVFRAVNTNIAVDILYS